MVRGKGQECDPRWLALTKIIGGKKYNYCKTEPTDKDIRVKRKRGYNVRVTTRNGVREMWIRKGTRR